MKSAPPARERVTETNGDPDMLLEEATEVLRVESDHSWWVIIEHTSSDRLIEVPCNSQATAIALLDRIEQAFEAGRDRIRIDPLHLVSLKRFRQAWVSDSHA